MIELYLKVLNILRALKVIYESMKDFSYICPVNKTLCTKKSTSAIVSSSGTHKKGVLNYQLNCTFKLYKLNDSTIESGKKLLATLVGFFLSK